VDGEYHKGRRNPRFSVVGQNSPLLRKYTVTEQNELSTRGDPQSQYWEGKNTTEANDEN